MPLSVICAAKTLFAVFAPPSVSVCAVFALAKVSGPAWLNSIAPVPHDSSLLAVEAPSVNCRLVLSPVPTYRSVPPLRTRLLAAEEDEGPADFVDGCLHCGDVVARVEVACAALGLLVAVPAPDIAGNTERAKLDCHTSASVPAGRW